MRTNISKTTFLLLLGIFITLATNAQRTVYQLKFNGTNTENDILFGWSVKNNTLPLTGEGEDGWTIFGGDDGYIGPPFDASSTANFNNALNGYLSNFATVQRENGLYKYASVGYSENDFDGAHISKWLISRVFYGIKNGDQIKFRTKQKWISSTQNALAVATQNANGFDCNRPNRLEVRLSVGDYSDFIPANVGTSPTSVGTFTNLLLTINPNLIDTGYPREWKEYTVTVSGLPVGKKVSGRIAFRYNFENGGYAGCRARKSTINSTIGTIESFASTMPLPSAAGNAFLAYNIGNRVLSAITNPQSGENGSFIGLDDFRYIRSSSHYVEDLDDNIWYNGIEPVNRIHFGYAGSPNCFVPGIRSDNNFYFSNNSATPITIYASTTSGNGLQAFDIKVNGTSNLTYTVPAYSTVFIKLELKQGLPILNNDTYENLIIKQDGATGATLHTIKLKYKIVPPPPPVVTCTSFPRPLILSPTTGTVTLTDPVSFDNGSVSNGCGGALAYSFSKFKNVYDTSVKQLTFNCADVGIKPIFLVVTDLQGGGIKTCPIFAEVKRPNSSIVTTTQNYYINYTGVMPIDSLKEPKENGPCSTTAIPQLIWKGANRSVNYLNASSIPVGSYQVEWNLSYTSGSADTRTVITQLNVLDTIKPRAFCKDTARLGFNYVTVVGSWPPRVKIRDDVNPFRDIDNGSNDNSSGNSGGRGISKYSIYSPWYSGALQYFADSFEIQCSDIGASFPVTLKVADASGNFSTCESYVKIISPSAPECKNITIALNPTTGIRNITTSDVLANGVSGVCGMTNVSLSRSSFNCTNINQTIPVTVGYLDPSNVVRGCVANVTVKAYSIPEGSCLDTVKVNLTTSTQYLADIPPLVLSGCGTQLPWSLTISNFTFNNLTGNKPWNFNPGFTNVSRISIAGNDTFRCNQTYAIFDTTPPVITSTPINENRTIPFLNNNCKYPFEIPNIFQQGSYREWSYTFSGATNKKVVVSPANYYQYNTYWLNQWDSVNQGVTTVTLTAIDHVGNQSSRTYTITLNVLNPFNPSVGYFGASIPTIRGNICGNTYNHFIESPVIAPCDQTGYMWYFQLKDNSGNVLFEQDSIPQQQGAFIPLRVSAYLEHYYSNRVEFGFHDKTDAHKVYSSTSFATVIDTVSPVIVPANIFIQNTNNTTFNFPYTIPSPIKYGGSCSGARWGYKITGATNLASTVDPSVTYSQSQQVELGMNTYYSQSYPSIPADSSPTVILKNGLNTIEYVILEESGVSSLWQPLVKYKYNVNIEDVSFPQMTCPTNDTLYRSSGPCNVIVANPGAQVNGFNGPFGKTRFELVGGNKNITLRKSTAPDSITFVSSFNNSSAYKPAYIYMVFNHGGTVSFNWTYQCQFPQFFVPFATTDTLHPNRLNTMILSGFNSSSSAVQNGTFTKTVKAGETLKIGFYEGGAAAGYLRLSNFSAPHKSTIASISQPTFPDNEAYFFESDIDTIYPIGNNLVTYSLTNLNNNRTTYCTKSIVVIDSFARSLNCQNKTLYLGSLGTVDLTANEVLPSSCFPVSSTYLSKIRFTGSDIGTQSVSITSIGSNNDTLRCNFNVTVIDTVSPKPRLAQISLPLSSANTAILTDSIVKDFFFDNHKIVNVTKAKTNFNCDDVGAQKVLLTATDSVGNITSVLAHVVVTPGFSSNIERTNTIQACSKDSIRLYANSNPGYALNYQWQVKENADTVKHWNYYSCAENIPFLSGADGHKFFKLNNETYLAYSTGTAIEFKKLDTISNNWRSALAPITANLSTYSSFVIHIRPGYPEELEVAYINSSPRSFNMKLYGPSTNSWFTQNDLGLDFFTYQTASAPVNTTDGRNYFFDQLYGDNGYYFPVNNLADVYAVNRDSIGFTRSYYRIRDTVQDWTGLWNIYRKDYDWYTSDPWVPSGAPAPSYVTSGKQVVAIRNTANQNIFFGLTFMPNGVIGGKDSLTTDPTGGSSVFVMKSFNNADYIAYKSSNGKVCVKQYNGSNNWSFVGSPDFSNEQINKVSLGIVANALYLVYVETTGNMFVKKLDGSSWTDMGSPNTNINVASVGNELSIVDINGKPGIYFTLSTGGSQRLIIQSGWKNISGQTANSYKPNISVGGQSEYRCVMGNTCGLFSASEISKVQVTQSPTISMLTPEMAVIRERGTQLLVNSTGANITWKYGFQDGAALLGSGVSLTIPTVFNDTIVYAYANNDNCYSDTVSSIITALDTSLAIYNISVEDSVCSSDYAEISLDTALVGKKYTLLIKNSNNEYVSAGSSTTIYSPFQRVVFYVQPTQTEKYKIRVENAIPDAVSFTPWETYGDHINFGNDSLPIGKELTIEAWVLGGPDPQNVLGIQYKNGNALQPATTKNWEWAGNQFKVYRGTNTRTLTFPPFQTAYEWMHVATTAGPNGMKIYYDGVLVASSTSAIDTININTVSTNLRVGWKDSLTKPSELYAMDEFRVWNKERTAAEIANMKDACLTGNETGLVLSNSFSSYASGTKTFTSLTGPNGVYVMHPSNNYAVQQYEHNGSCIQGNVQHLTGPITVNVIPNQPSIVYLDDNYEAPDTICGGTVVKLVAKASNGLVRWYSDYKLDSLIGTGDTLTYFATENVTLYPTAANSVCQRKEIEIELNDEVQVYSTEVDPYCAGMEINDNSFRINYDGDAYRVYNDSVGGTPLDIFSWQGIGAGTGADGDRVLTQSDTLWVEAYNYTGWGSNRVATCVSANRKPIFLTVVPIPRILSTKDSSRYEAGTVVLEATADSGATIQWFELGGNYVGEGSPFTTPHLTSTKSYRVRAINLDVFCWESFDTVTAEIKQYLTRKDTILACESYTWVDGVTYTASDTNITFKKPNINGVDSLLKLNLTIIGFQQPTLQVGKSSICTGDSTIITIQTTQAGYHYMLIDTGTNTIVGQPLYANGSALAFNTGTLQQSKVYKILATDSVNIGNKSLSCIKQISQPIAIEVGRLRSFAEVSICGNYFWRGNNYTQSGVYFDTVPSTQGCDSVLELRLTIFPVKEHIDTVVACSSYTWYGTTYTTSTTSPTRWVGITEFGCDSLVRLHLTLNNSTATDTRVAWDSLTWINGIKYTSNNNTAQYTLTNTNGCDSLVTLNLTVLNSVARTWYFPASICNGSSYLFNGDTYTTTGNHRDTLVSSSGLKDSILVLQLTVNPTYSVNNPRTICSGGSYVFNSNTYTVAGTYRDTLQSVTGCDSIVVTQLTVNPTYSVNNPRTICSGGSYVFNSNTYTVAGTYRDTLQSVSGCDSIVVTQLTVNPTYSVNNPRTICSGGSYVFNSNTYTVAGT
jgi:hypothetical protein